MNTIQLGNIDNFDPALFEQLLGNFFNLDIQITESGRVNNSNYKGQFYGRDGSVFIEAPELAQKVAALTTVQKNLLQQAGIVILSVEVNTPPTTPPPPPRPVRVIPTGAVAVIVVLNSVIIIFILLLILGVVVEEIL